MDIYFDNLEELYERIKPALRTKCSEMNRQGYEYIKIEDIWNYLKEIKWKNDHDLSLYQMVNDVLNVDNFAIDNYLKSKLNLKERVVYFNVN